MKKVSPFIKWIGGKTRLIKRLDKHLPKLAKQGEFNYVEPFLGGGAVFFYIISNYRVKKAHLNDLNNHLINLYLDIKNDHKSLCDSISSLENKYRSSNNKKEYYLEKRDRFNSIGDSIEKSSIFIFLNKTGFNGMYRENSKGEFNIPFGNMKNPTILNKQLISNVSELLNNNDIILTSKSFEKIRVKEINTFYYIDPPYRPISKTSSFTDYTKSDFNDKNQKKLKKYCDLINDDGNSFMQSNSYSEDGFFQELYNNRKIDNLDVMRTIGADGKKRVKVKEIIIKNYD